MILLLVLKKSRETHNIIASGNLFDFIFRIDTDFIVIQIRTFWRCKHHCRRLRQKTRGRFQGRNGGGRDDLPGGIPQGH